MIFRRDINGLRAIAVIAVVIFHFNPAWLPGGFVGVDVFFVISGFLMTGIIFKGLENDNFNLFKFYKARAYRIVPALAILCLVILAFGYFYLTPLDYKVLGKHVASSMSFLSNVIYWRESGYFDAESYEKWLLHTWSLSVEWQFYIIYPLVLVAMRKCMPVEQLKSMVFLGTIFGFIFSVFATYKWPDSAYYLLHTRAWEMMIGGVAYLYPIDFKKRTKLLEWFGFSLIIGSYFLVSKDTLWPGYLVLFPVLGTFLIIQAQHNNSFITNNVIFQKLGTWSYSIYLWHWPVVVLMNNQEVAINNSVLWGLFVTISLGYISHQLFEKKRIKNIIVYSLPIFISGAVFWLDGLNQRFDGLDSIQSSIVSSKKDYLENYNHNYTRSEQNIDDMYTCSYDEKLPMEKLIPCIDRKIDNEGYLIIGDSHGRDLLLSLKYAYPDENFAMLHGSGCPPANYLNLCFPFMSEFINYVNDNSKIKGVIFSSSFYKWKKRKLFIEDINNNLYKVDKMFIVSAGPLLSGSVDTYVINNGEVAERYEVEEGLVNLISATNKQLESLATSKNIKFYNKYNVFCMEKQCKLHNSNNEVYFFDNQHLSIRGIMYFGDNLKKSGFLSINP